MVAFPCVAADSKRRVCYKIARTLELDFWRIVRLYRWVYSDDYRPAK